MIFRKKCTIKNYIYTEIPDLVTKVATTAGNWLKLETGARAVGMGGAQVAAASGVSAVSYNPASIAFINKGQVYFSHTSLYADISHSTFAFGTRLTNTDFFGLSIFYVNSGEILGFGFFGNIKIFIFLKIQIFAFF